jgi:hypothetical protein
MRRPGFLADVDQPIAAPTTLTSDLISKLKGPATDLVTKLRDPQAQRAAHCKSRGFCFTPSHLEELKSEGGDCGKFIVIQRRAGGERLCNRTFQQRLDGGKGKRICRGGRWTCSMRRVPESCSHCTGLRAIPTKYLIGAAILAAILLLRK